MITVTSLLWIWKGEAAGRWYFITVPEELSAEIRAHALGDPRGFGSVRVEAALTVCVLAVTAVLSMTSPPPQITVAAEPGPTAPANGLTVMPLKEKGSAGLGIIPATTTGSRLNLLLTGPSGQPMQAKAVELEVSNPSRGVGGIAVPMTLRNGVWSGRFRFPFPGDWKAVLTVHDRSATAVVTGGTFTISP